MILAGDVGGTKVVLALYEVGVGSLEKVREQTYASRDFPSLESICLDFLDRHFGERRSAGAVRMGCFGVPGAVVEGFCRTTNLPWVLSEEGLAVALGIPRVALLNDLQAGAFGMLYLEASELAVLNPGREARRANYGVIAAGTGLGEGFLAWTGERHVPVASEGGHATFSPRNDLEWELRRFIARRLGGDDEHVSWERLLSGPGLGNIYDFLKAQGFHDESPAVREKMLSADKGAVVGVEAVNGTDRLCLAAAELFASLYGAEAGNVALKFMATGGIFVGGGIAPRLLPILQQGAFMKSFVDKGRFCDLLSSIPVAIALNHKAPLIGAARYGASLLVA